MSTSKFTNILHLTDLHYKSARSYDQGIVLRALLDDVQKMAQSVGEPDLIVFSGDLVHNADDEKIYDKLYDNFLEELLKVTNCDHSRLFITPGNHDIHRSFIVSNQDEQEKLLGEFTDRNKLNAAYLDGSINGFARNKSSAFYDFAEFFEPKGKLFSNEFASAYDLPELGISIVNLNTSWLGWSGFEKRVDLRLLAVPEAALSDVIGNIPPGRYIVFNFHHPVHWQADYAASDFQDLAESKADLFLYGHVHDPRPTTIGGDEERLVHNQAGALYTWRQDRYLGYSMIRVEPEKKYSQIILRSYFDKRRAFDAATNISSNAGIYHSCSKSESFFNEVLDNGKLEKLKSWITGEVLSRAVEEYSEGILEKPTQEVFVPPPLVQLALDSTDQEDQAFIEKDLHFKEMLNGRHNYVIEALPEYGKTALLQQLCIETARAAEARSNHSHLIPILLHFRAFSPGKNRIERAIRDGLPALPEGCTVEGLLSDGCFTVLIDDISQTDTKRISEVRNFVSKYKNNRFILTTTTVRRQQGIMSDFGLSAHFENVVLKEFRRTDLRKLVQKLDDGGSSEEDLLNRVIAELRAINVPATPINSSLLVDIISRDSSFSPLNRPALIERFIESLLKKRSLAEVERKKFDFTNQVHYLGSVAEFMCRENKYVLHHDEIFRFTDSYLQGLGLNFGAREIIDNTITSKIFLERKDGGIISFRFRAFLEFFVATQMRTDATFRAWVLEENRYLSYMNEIEYYAGLVRNDESLLQLVSKRHISYHDDLFGADFKRLFDDVEIPNLPMSLEENEKFSADFAEQLQEMPMSQSERDEVLDAELPRDAEGRQEVFRPNASDLPSKYMISLFIYSGLVKNTELIDDTVKRYHLANVLQSWASTILTSFFLIPNLVKHRRMIINGLSYVVSFPRGYTDDQVAKHIAINLPKEVARLVYLLVGTEKLEVQLSQTTIQETNEPDLVEFIRCSLRMDLKFGEWWKTPRQFSNRVKGNRSLQETMLSKSNEIYRLGSFSDSIRNALEDEIVDIYSSVYSVSKERRQELRNNKKKKMQRSRHINTLRAQLPSSKNGD